MVNSDHRRIVSGAHHLYSEVAVHCESKIGVGLGRIMKNIKFVVKVTRGSHAPSFVQRTNPTPVQMTTNRKLALVMGRLTAEDIVKSIQNSKCFPELIPVQVTI
jgi:hypothetical protein